MAAWMALNTTTTAPVKAGEASVGDGSECRADAVADGRRDGDEGVTELAEEVQQRRPAVSEMIDMTLWAASKTPMRPSWNSGLDVIFWMFSRVSRIMPRPEPPPSDAASPMSPMIFPTLSRMPPMSLKPWMPASMNCFSVPSADALSRKLLELRREGVDPGGELGGTASQSGPAW